MPVEVTDHLTVALIDLLERARRKRERKGADALVVNRVGWDRGFESADNEVTLIGPDGAVLAEVSGTKRQVADGLWDTLRPLLH